MWDDFDDGLPPSLSRCRDCGHPRGRARAADLSEIDALVHLSLGPEEEVIVDCHCEGVPPPDCQSAHEGTGRLPRSRRSQERCEACDDWASWWSSFPGSRRLTDVPRADTRFGHDAPGVGASLVYGAVDGWLLFLGEADALARKQLMDLMRSKPTWGELRCAFPDEWAFLVHSMAGELTEQSIEAERQESGASRREVLSDHGIAGCLPPEDDEAFDPDFFDRSWADMGGLCCVWPLPVAQQMAFWMPAEASSFDEASEPEEYGVEFPEEAERDLVACLVRRGYRCRRDDALVASASSWRLPSGHPDADDDETDE